MCTTLFSYQEITSVVPSRFNVPSCQPWALAASKQHCPTVVDWLNSLPVVRVCSIVTVFAASGILNWNEVQTAAVHCSATQAGPQVIKSRLDCNISPITSPASYHLFLSALHCTYRLGLHHCQAFLYPIWAWRLKPLYGASLNLMANVYRHWETQGIAAGAWKSWDLKFSSLRSTIGSIPGGKSDDAWMSFGDKAAGA
jgi:hypothetical protein